VFDRSTDGDFVLNTHAKRSELYLRKNNSYSENTIYPFLTTEHFEEGIVQRAKTIIRSNRPSHPWLTLDDNAFYAAAGLYRTDLQTNQTGFTLAALLLFGKEEAILSMLPHYKVDALVRRIDMNRYDDRETFRCNLITAYELLMHFVKKHLPDKFYLEGEQRISLRDLIFRELIANFLIHREYLNPRVSNLEINTEKCVIKNANKPHLYGSIEPTNYESFPKNPHIAKFFVQLARAEELGSGIRNVFRYSQLYSGKQPEFKEEDLFEVSIPLLVKKTTKETTKETAKKTTKETTKETAKETTKETTKRLKDREVLIISLITENNKINAVELAKKVDLSTDGIRYYLKKLKRKGILQRSGPTKGGAWVVLTKKFK